MLLILFGKCEVLHHLYTYLFTLCKGARESVYLKQFVYHLYLVKCKIGYSDFCFHTVDRISINCVCDTTNKSANKDASLLNLMSFIYI